MFAKICVYSLYSRVLFVILSYWIFYLWVYSLSQEILKGRKDDLFILLTLHHHCLSLQPLVSKRHCHITYVVHFSLVSQSALTSSIMGCFCCYCYTSYMDQPCRITVQLFSISQQRFLKHSVSFYPNETYTSIITYQDPV